MSNNQLNQLILCGLGALAVCAVLYLLRWYLIAGLVGFGVYQVCRQLNRP